MACPLSLSHRLDDLDTDEELQEQLEANDGFVDNKSRGTAHVFRCYFVKIQVHFLCLVSKAILSVCVCVCVLK